VIKEMIETVEIFYANALEQDSVALLELEKLCFQDDVKYRRVLKRYFMSQVARCLVARLNGIPVGYALITFSATMKSAHLIALCVDPKLRRNEIGANLLACAEIEALHEGASLISVEIDIQNSETIHMLDQQGYEENNEELSLIPYGTEGIKMRKRLFETKPFITSKTDSHEIEISASHADHFNVNR
jgi:ribosomal protein S18 acetylase RimI-like enzyme